MCPLYRFLLNQCQIITFLILKSDKIENSRIELKGTVLPVPSNQIKVTFIIILPFNLVLCDFFLLHIEIEGKCGWIIGGQRVCWPPLKLLSRPLPPPPPPPRSPSSFAYDILKNEEILQNPPPQNRTPYNILHCCLASPSCDYFLFPKLKYRLSGKRCNSRNALGSAVYPSV